MGELAADGRIVANEHTLLAYSVLIWLVRKLFLNPLEGWFTDFRDIYETLCRKHWVHEQVHRILRPLEGIILTTREAHDVAQMVDDEAYWGATYWRKEEETGGWFRDAHPEEKSTGQVVFGRLRQEINEPFYIDPGNVVARAAIRQAVQAIACLREAPSALSHPMTIWPSGTKPTKAETSFVKAVQSIFGSLPDTAPRVAKTALRQAA